MKRKNLKKLKWFNRLTFVKNIVFDAHDLKQKGSRFQIVKFKPGQKIDSHYHKKVYEIFYIRDGKGIIRINGRKYELQKDDIFLCEPGDKHSFENTGKKDLTILVFKTNETTDAPDKDIYWK